MKEKEKFFICFLALIVSISILFIIIFNSIDFSGIKVRTLGTKIIKNFNKFQDEKINEDYDCSNIGHFTEYQININSTLGRIENYKCIGNYKNDGNNEKYISSLYDVEFSKYPNIPIRINLVFLNNNNKLKIVDFRLLSENLDKNSELYKIVEVLNSKNEIGEDEDINNAKNVVAEIIKYYEKEEYENIYEMLTDQLKNEGSESDFINYLKNQKSEYISINDAKFYGYEISNNKLEYKLNYYVENSNSKKIFITFWIINSNDNIHLSGIKFSNYVW